MPFKNTAQTYGSVTKTLHWLIAILIILMLIVGFNLSHLSDSKLMLLAFTTHKLTGLTILLLMLIRIVWIIQKPTPHLPRTMPGYERALSHAVRGLLYLVLILMPLSGWMMSTAFGHPPMLGKMVLAFPGLPLNYQLARLLFYCHLTLAYTIIALVILHILGALKHYFIDRDGIAERMLP